MIHKEIRFRILFQLYYNYYVGNLGAPINTNQLITDAGLEYVEKEIILGDIVYLREKNLIIGVDAIGYSYPIAIRISTFGIDEIETVITNFLDFLKTNGDQEAKDLFNNYDLVAGNINKLRTLQWIIDSKGRNFFSQFCNEYNR